MNTELKKGLLIFGGGLLLFWILKKVRPVGKVKTKKSSEKSEKTPTPEEKKNALIMMEAYSAAKKAGENKMFLDEMNSEFAKEFNLKVYTDRGSGKLFVADLEGNKIM